MKRYWRVGFSFSMSILFLTSIWTAGLAPVAALELVWEGVVYHDGVPVSTAPVILEDGRLYRIEVAEIWWYDFPNNLAADAYYYTTDGSDPWDWGNYFHIPALPPYHSFLQIDGMDVDWGPFSNGDTGHTYSIDYYGKGAAITFQIVDWMDNDYDNNDSHLPIRIYLYPLPPKIVGGVLAPTNKLVVLAPYLTLVGLVGAISTVFAVRRKRKA